MEFQSLTRYTHPDQLEALKPSIDPQDLMFARTRGEYIVGTFFAGSEVTDGVTISDNDEYSDIDALRVFLDHIEALSDTGWQRGYLLISRDDDAAQFQIVVLHIINPNYVEA